MCRANGENLETRKTIKKTLENLVYEPCWLKRFRSQDISCTNDDISLLGTSLVIADQYLIKTVIIFIDNTVTICRKLLMQVKELNKIYKFKLHPKRSVTLEGVLYFRNPYY